jgi:RNA polymerase-binding protein DksA
VAKKRSKSASSKGPKKSKKASKSSAKKSSKKKTTRKKAAKKKAAPKKRTAKKTRKSVKKAKKTAAKKISKKASKKAKKAKKAMGASQPEPKATVKKAVKKAKKKIKDRKLKSPLTKKQLEMFREMLLEKRRDLLGDMSGIEHTALGADRGNGASDLMPTHPADLGSDNYEQEFTLGLLASERTLLKEIHEALERIDEGIYGICLGTAKPIGLPRLKARPWAKYCIDYARMVEKGMVRPGETLFDNEDEEE